GQRSLAGECAQRTSHASGAETWPCALHTGPSLASERVGGWGATPLRRRVRAAHEPRERSRDLALCSSHRAESRERACWGVGGNAPSPASARSARATRAEPRLGPVLVTPGRVSRASVLGGWGATPLRRRVRAAHEPRERSRDLALCSSHRAESRERACWGGGGQRPFAGECAQRTSHASGAETWPCARHTGPSLASERVGGVGANAPSPASARSARATRAEPRLGPVLFTPGRVSRASVLGGWGPTPLRRRVRAAHEPRERSRDLALCSSHRAESRERACWGGGGQRPFAGECAQRTSHASGAETWPCALHTGPSLA